MRHLLAFSFVFILLQFPAQEIKKTQDLGLWLGATAEYKFGQDYTVSLSQDLRLFESLSQVDKYISELGIDYKINKKFKLGCNIRYYLNKDDDLTFSQNYRYSLDFKFREKIGERMKLKYRLRFQSTYEELFAVVDEGNKSNLRNKLDLSYELNDQNSLYFSSEIFREIVIYRKPYFNKARFLLGNDWDSSIGKFDFSLGYERELNTDYPFHYFFTRVYYTFRIKK